MVVDNIATKNTKFLKIQSKGRSLNNATHVKIPASYVTQNFVLLLYLKSTSATKLYFFDHEEISNWEISGDEFILRIPKNSLTNEKFSAHEFDHRAAERMRLQLTRSEIKKYSSLVIEEDFIQSAIDKAIAIYSDIYPERSFTRPTTSEVAVAILSTYSVHQSNETPVRCHIFYSENQKFPAESDDFRKAFAKEGQEIRIYRESTSPSVALEILEYLDRIINVENVILAVDDFIYEEPLNRLKENGVDIKIIQFSSSEGRQVFTQHMWGDVIYVVATAMGLNRYEW